MSVTEVLAEIKNWSDSDDGNQVDVLILPPDGDQAVSDTEEGADEGTTEAPRDVSGQLEILLSEQSDPKNKPQLHWHERYETFG